MDLTEHFLSAHSQAGNWQKGHNATLSKMKSKGFRIRWDEDDGETWGRIFLNEKLAAIFHAQLPFYFINETDLCSLQPIIQDSHSNIPIIVKIPDWSLANYSADFEKLTGIIEWHSCLSSEKFSIDDLWYATV